MKEGKKRVSERACAANVSAQSALEREIRSKKEAKTTVWYKF